MVFIFQFKGYLYDLSLDKSQTQDAHRWNGKVVLYFELIAFPTFHCKEALKEEEYLTLTEKQKKFKVCIIMIFYTFVCALLNPKHYCSHVHCNP